MQPMRECGGRAGREPVLLSTTPLPNGWQLLAPSTDSRSQASQAATALFMPGSDNRNGVMPRNKWTIGPMSFPPQEANL